MVTIESIKLETTTNDQDLLHIDLAMRKITCSLHYINSRTKTHHKSFSIFPLWNYPATAQQLKNQCLC